MALATYVMEMKKINISDEDLKFATLIITTAANIDKSREKAKEIFGKYDTDHNGFLDKDEIKKMIKNLAEDGDLYLPQCMSTGPTDGKEKDQIKAYEAILFNEFDKNKDAKFSLDEITNFVYFPTIGKYMKDFQVTDPVPILNKAKSFIKTFVYFVNNNKRQMQKLVDQALIGKKNKYELMNEYFGEGVEFPGKSITNDYFYLTMFWGFFSYGSEDAYLISSIPNVMRQVEIINTLPAKIDDAIKLSEEFLTVLEHQGFHVERAKPEPEPEENKEEEKKEEGAEENKEEEKNEEGKEEEKKEEKKEDPKETKNSSKSLSKADTGSEKGSKKGKK